MSGGYEDGEMGGWIRAPSSCGGKEKMLCERNEVMFFSISRVVMLAAFPVMKVCYFSSN